MSPRYLTIFFGGMLFLLPQSLNADPPYTEIFNNTSVQSQADHNMTRAGNATDISRIARPGVTNRYAIGYVGGSRLVGGDGPAPALGDGVFGWDYNGISSFPGRRFLHWSHDRPIQPKYGTYATVGPRTPDFPLLRPIRRAVLKGKENQ